MLGVSAPSAMVGSQHACVWMAAYAGQSFREYQRIRGRGPMMQEWVPVLISGL